MQPPRRRLPRPPAFALAPVAWVPVLAQADDEIIPSDPGARTLFVIIGLVILGLYFLLRRTRRRSVEAYWSRKRREEELRAADPDMRKDES